MKTEVVILAAGQGKRMKSPVPKPLIPLLGKPLLEWILDAVDQVEGLASPLVVVGHGEEKIREAFQHRNLTFVTQSEQLGTGHALQMCLPELTKRQADRVLVLVGDAPLISPETLQILTSQESDGSVVAFEVSDPSGYGRVVLDDKGGFSHIVEEADATEDEKDIRLVNAGLYILPVNSLAEKLKSIENNNAQGEVYLTEVPEQLAKEGAQISLVELMDPMEAAGINNPMQLAEVVQEAKAIVFGQLLDQGVLIDDPTTTWIEADVEIAPGAKILPFTVIRRGVKIEEACEVGPFTHLREGTILKKGADVGNFTEVKNSTLGANSKAKHLSYLGDAELGARVNVGAGTIFANYDGVRKHPTKVGDDVFLGSGTVLVAPVSVGDNARTGAGAVVTARSDIASGQTVAGVPAKPLEKKETR